MDSSALGMLLLLREHVDGVRERVRIINCNTEIRKILEIANFDKLFDIG
jgi:anti-anti-sigma factor